MSKSVPASSEENGASSAPSPALNPATVARCRQFLQLQRKDSIPERISLLRAKRIEEARPKPGELVASKDKKRDPASDAGEISLMDIVAEVISPVIDDIITGNRMQEYADLIFVDPDIESLEVDEFVAGYDFFTIKSRKLSEVLTNSGKLLSSIT